MIKACVFDLDGTLLDTLPAIRHFVNVFMEKHGLESISLQKTAEFVGDGAARLIERAIGYSGIDKESEEGKRLFSLIHPDYVREYNDNPTYLTAPYDGIPEALAALRSEGIILAILSNKPHETVKSLGEEYFPGAFDVILGAREGIPLKPDPESALEVCGLLGLEPSEVAYFGDTGVDIKTGKAFGAALTVGVLWGFRGKEELSREGADALIECPDRIVSIIKGEGSNEN